MKLEYNNESLNRHEVSRSDVDEVLDIENATRRDFELQLSSEENLRIMFVGYNLAGRLLEVGIEYKSEIRGYIFHAQSVSPKYRKLYEERITDE